MLSFKTTAMSSSNRNNGRATGKHILLPVLILLSAIFFSTTPCHAQDEQTRVTAAFQAFTTDWVRQVSAAYLHHRNTPKVEHRSGIYLASYHILDTNSMRWDVKPAAGQPGVYTGVLFYNEHLVQSRGETRETAVSGEYTTVSVRQMMEIFLYENGRWVR